MVIGWALLQVLHHPEAFPAWRTTLYTATRQSDHDDAVALLLFPKLALGLSGFETGVAVMPLVQGIPDDEPVASRRPIRNAKKLLRTAALIMSVLLIGSSLRPRC